MVFIDRDPLTRTYGYHIIQNVDGQPGGAQRVLWEQYGWQDPGEVLTFVEDMKKAINEGVKTAFR